MNQHEHLAETLLLFLQRQEMIKSGKTVDAAEIQLRIEQKTKRQTNAAEFQGRKCGSEWVETQATNTEIAILLGITERPDIEKLIAVGNPGENDTTGWLFTEIKGGQEHGVWNQREFLGNKTWCDVFFDTPEFTRGFINGAMDELGWLTIEDAADLLEMDCDEFNRLLERAKYTPRSFGGISRIMNFELKQIIDGTIG